MYDLIVIGGGIVGMSAAYHAVSSGARTLLIDRADPGKASLAGAGILDPPTSSIDSEDWYRLALAAVDYYPSLIAELQSQGITDPGYARTDSIMVAITADEDERFAAMQQRLAIRRERYGRPAAEHMHSLDEASARQLFPPIAPIRAGMRFEGAARIDAGLILRAMQQVAQQKYGLHMRRDSVERLLIRDDRFSGVVLSGERILTQSLIIAGGAWSPSFAGQLKITLPVVPQRGQIAHLLLPGVDTSSWPVVIAFHGHYMVPWADSRIVVGATREMVGYEPYTTASGLRELMTEALRVAPGLAEATIGEIKVGLRPSSPDLLPILGPIPTIPNVYLATGHGASGLQLGPYSGKLVVEMALGNAPDFSLDAFSCTRFG